MKARDVINLVIVFVPACTLGVCVVIVGVPVARVAFTWSTWAGLGVTLAVLALAVSPLTRLLALLPDEPPDG